MPVSLDLDSRIGVDVAVAVVDAAVVAVDAAL